MAAKKSKKLKKGSKLQKTSSPRAWPVKYTGAS
jgi:hypothetical protein